MKALAVMSMFVLAMASPVRAAAAESSQSSGPAVSPVRAVWPIAREASGAWGVIGEVSVRPAAGRPVTLQSLTFTVEGPFGRTLSAETFDAATLGQIAFVFTRDAAGAQVTRPAGTLTVEPGDVAVVFLSALIQPDALPRRARATLHFDADRPQTVAVPLEAFTTPQKLSFPLGLTTEPWAVTNSAGTAHHWVGGTVILPRGVAISQRFAMDLVQIDGSLETHPAGSASKESYYAWGEAVRSMGDGKVVSVLTGQRDLEIGEDPDLAAHPAGNHVVVQYGPGLFALYAHLQEGSPVVRTGDRVARGQILGRVGNSGNTTEPHLHLHVVDRWAGSEEPLADFYLSQGVPALFWGARVIREGAPEPMRLRGTTPLEHDLVVN